MMQLDSTPQTCRQVAGIVHDVDPVGRTIALAGRAAPLRFTIPADCSVRLHGEPVKQRLLQPRDHVRVTYEGVAGGYAARMIEAGGSH